ncbi:MAG: hypothetical protein KF876_09905 [Nitrospira sp.]|nr:hypothetical protein [Nitrospira sp.]MDR4465187.1 hypothetical protein [Nitrospira sp.]
MGVPEGPPETILWRIQPLSDEMGFGTESVDASLSASRRGFLFGTILVFIMNFAVIVLAGARGIPEWTDYLAFVGILAHVILIHRREQALYRSRRWRFWYALFFAGFACNLMTRHLWMQGHDSIVDPIQLRGQLLIGGFLLFYVLVSPVMLGLLIRNQKS